MPLLKRRGVLAAKLEVTAGTAVTLTSGVDGVINAYDISIDADIPWNKRMAQGSFSRQLGVPGARAGSLKFKVEAFGSGTGGTPPAWANVLLAACGMSVTAGLFTPVSAAASQQTATLAVWEDGAYKVLAGAMGTWSFDGDDGKPGVFSFDFKGIWQPVTDLSTFAPVFGTVIPPRFAGASLTIGAFAPRASKLQIGYGAKVELRQDITQTSGYIAAIITDREVEGSLDPELTLVASYDAFGAWLAGTAAALSMTIGSGGTGFTIACPQTQYSEIKEGDRNGIFTNQLKFAAAQNGSTIDSEISIQF